jgi:hypothetical protein
MNTARPAATESGIARRWTQIHADAENKNAQRGRGFEQEGAERTEFLSPLPLGPPVERTVGGQNHGSQNHKSSQLKPDELATKEGRAEGPEERRISAGSWAGDCSMRRSRCRPPRPGAAPAQPHPDPGSSPFSADSRPRRQGSGSANVPLAVGRVSRPATALVLSHGWFFGLAAFKEKTGRNVFGGTPNTARETHALPECPVARSDPLKRSKTPIRPPRPISPTAAPPRLPLARAFCYRLPGCLPISIKRLNR